MSHGKAGASLHGMAPSEPHLSKTCSAQVWQASFHRSSGLPMLEDSVLIHDRHGDGRPTAGLVAHSGIKWLRSTFKLLPLACWAHGSQEQNCSVVLGQCIVIHFIFHFHNRSESRQSS